MPGDDAAAAGRRLGVDVGDVRVGVAVCDPAGLVATPLTTLRRDRHTERDLDRLAELVAEHDAVEVVVGLPRTLRARHGPAAQGAQHYAVALAARLGAVPVRLSDERLTTARAQNLLAEQGIRGRRQRAVVDQAAAVEILQTWLDAPPRARTPRTRTPRTRRSRTPTRPPHPSGGTESSG